MDQGATPVAKGLPVAAVSVPDGLAGCAVKLRVFDAPP
jgi:hypothetical protein